MEFFSENVHVSSVTAFYQSVSTAPSFKGILNKDVRGLSVSLVVSMSGVGYTLFVHQLIVCLKMGVRIKRHW